MTSSKFPLYLTDKEWKLALTLIESARFHLPTYSWRAESERILVEKLKDQLEKLGVKTG